MSAHHLVSSFATAAVVGITALVGGSPGPAISPPVTLPPLHPDRQSGVQIPGPQKACEGVTRCHVVASRDVSGDARADQIAWRQVSDQTAQIRVSTVAGTLMTANVDVSLWFGGGAFGGAARVDDHAGAEILVGSNQGAHTPMYTMLTVRAGRLVVEKSPSPLDSLWQVDAAYGDYMGWWRHVTAGGRVTMTQKIAFRTGNTTHFTGSDVTYAWSGGHWTRTTSSATTYPTQRLAAAIAGFHVAGLEAFPGIG